MSKRAERARELFTSGYNCAQTMALTFSDLVEVDESRPCTGILERAADLFEDYLSSSHS